MCLLDALAVIALRIRQAKQALFQKVASSSQTCPLLHIPRPQRTLPRSRS